MSLRIDGSRKDHLVFQSILESTQFETTPQPEQYRAMASAAIQAQANALNAKMEGEASKMLDEVERIWMRKVARQSFACAVKCYDKAGTSGPAESLESCTRNCQAPYQQSSNLIQQVRTKG